jgi:hypothetical protein
MEQTPKAIKCLQCGSLMRLALAPGGKGPRSLRCEQCDRPDPLGTSEAMGWLKANCNRRSRRGIFTERSGAIVVRSAIFVIDASTSRSRRQP